MSELLGLKIVSLTLAILSLSSDSMNRSVSEVFAYGLNHFHSSLYICILTHLAPTIQKQYTFFIEMSVIPNLLTLPFHAMCIVQLCIQWIEANSCVAESVVIWAVVQSDKPLLPFPQKYWWSLVY
jgi:hypothetical protein